MLSIDGASGFDPSQFTKKFEDADADGDGEISKSEFVAAAPDEVGAAKAGDLFDTLDQAGDGSLSQSDIRTAFQQIDSETKAALIGSQEQASGAGVSQTIADILAELAAEEDDDETNEEADGAVAASEPTPDAEENIQSLVLSV